MEEIALNHLIWSKLKSLGYQIENESDLEEIMESKVYNTMTQENGKRVHFIRLYPNDELILTLTTDENGLNIFIPNSNKKE